MTYFNLRKRDPAPGPDETGEPEADTEETEDIGGEEQPATARQDGPIVTGIKGPTLWLAARFSPGTSLAAHIGAIWATAYYGGWIAVALVAGWLLAVAAFTPRDYLDHLADRIENRAPAGSPEADGEPSVEATPEPLVALLWKLIGDAPGVHLKTLTVHLQEAAPDPLDKAAVAARLAALGIPVRPSVRDTRKKVNEGVHRDDLKAWEEARSPTGPDAPSGPRSGRVATALTCDVADGPTGVATPLSRLRALLARGAR